MSSSSTMAETADLVRTHAAEPMRDVVRTARRAVRAAREAGGQGPAPSPTRRRSRAEAARRGPGPSPTRRRSRPEAPGGARAVAGAAPFARGGSRRARIPSACRGGRCVAGASGGACRAWRPRRVARSGVVAVTGGRARSGGDGVAVAVGSNGGTGPAGGPAGSGRYDATSGFATAARDGTGGGRRRDVEPRTCPPRGTIQIGVVATSTTAASTPRGRGRARAGGAAVGRAATGGLAAAIRFAGWWSA